jgi:hypothetical protein
MIVIAFSTRRPTPLQTQMMKAGETEHSKFWSLLYATLHDNEEYGYLAVYLRLRNLVPPSTNSR